MDIAALGALGELIGGLAVVVSLVAVRSWRRSCGAAVEHPVEGPWTPPRRCAGRDGSATDHGHAPRCPPAAEPSASRQGATPASPGSLPW